MSKKQTNKNTAVLSHDGHFLNDTGGQIITPSVFFAKREKEKNDFKWKIKQFVSMLESHSFLKFWLTQLVWQWEAKVISWVVSQRLVKFADQNQMRIP
jgi:hypothetical protein